jgi:hypothetical protein
MARGKPINLGSRAFDTKGAATAHFKAMLARYGVGDRVDEVDSRDLSALLGRHPEYDEKVGSGIKHFEVMSADFGTRCFRVIRLDGTGVDFSYLFCIAQ